MLLHEQSHWKWNALLVYCRIFSRKKKKKNRTVSNDPFPWSTISNFSPNVLLGATNINTCTLNVDRYMYQLLLKNFLQIRFILFVYLFVCLHLRISFIVFYIYVSVYVLWMCVCELFGKVVAHLAALFGINIAKLHFMMWNEWPQIAATRRSCLKSLSRFGLCFMGISERQSRIYILSARM